MNRLLLKDTLRTVKKHFSRYLSILLIVALGTAFFVGIKATAPDMLENAANYFTDYNLADIRIRSSIGLTDNDLAALSQIEGVEYVSGEKFVDAFVYVNGELQQDIDGTAITTRAYGVSPQAIYDNIYLGANDGTYMNRLQSIEGDIPKQKNECLVDASRLSTPDTFKIGSVITLKNGGGEIPEELNTQEFTIVGIIRTPYYLSFERGNTDIGSGKLGTFIMIPNDAFSTDYYTEVCLKLKDADRYEPFSDEYIAFTDTFIQKVTDASPDLIAARVTEMRPLLAMKITNGETEIAQKEQEMTTGLEEIDAAIAQIQPYVNNGGAMIAEAQKQFDDTFANVESQYSDSSTRYQLALQDYTARRQTLEEKQAEYNANKATLDASQSLYDTLNAQYTAASTQVEASEKSIAQYNSLIDAAQDVLDQINDTQANAYSDETIQSVVDMMARTYPDLYTSVKSLTTSGLAGEIIANVTPYLEEQKSKLAQEEKKLGETKAKLEALGAQLDEKKAELQEAALKSSQAQQELQQAQSALNAYMDSLIQQGFNIPSTGVELLMKKMEAEAQLNELKSRISAAPAQLQALKQKKEEIQTLSATSLEFAKTELADAKALFAKLDEVTWSVYDRNDAPGYMSYGQSVNNIEVLSNIFPLFFFLISSLVCLSTVTRMVEEDRVLLGTYKAMGYGTVSILFKYVLYALSACVIGSAIGIGVGVFLFPYMINSAYSIMYSLPEMAYRFPVRYALIGFGIALFSTALVTVAAVLRDLRLKPSVLMRPKAPKKGKKILLERIRFFWRGLSFTSKVTARNLFRNKSRFLMTLAGVAGCTAMLLASLGFYNSISAIKYEQYDADDAISKYDFQVVFDEAQPGSEQSQVYQQIRTDASKSRINAMQLVSMKSMTGFGANEKKSTDVYVFVPEIPEEISTFIDLRSRKTGEKLTLSDSGAVITELLSNITGVDAGGTIRFKTSTGEVFSVKVAAIAENYTFNYIYMTPQLYTDTVGAPPEYTYAIGTVSNSYTSAGAKDMENMKGQLAKDLMKVDGVTTVAYLSETTESIGEITNALSLVILVFFASALILAFVVLYNLANINIIERTRELATLKVLGFNDTEIHRYILRENLIVSLFGVAFGIGLGIALHKLLITYTAIDTVMYGQKIYWYSFALAVGITALFIAGVNLLLRRKTVRIDMVESLKSVE